MNQLRRNPLTGEWIIVGKRIGGKQIFKYEKCPFCPGNEELTPPSIYSLNNQNGDWQVRVVPDKFPVLQIEGDLNKAGEGALDTMDGIGAHEIIIETPLHSANLSNLAEANLLKILKVWQTRIADLKKDLRFQYILLFRNQGGPTGVFTEHPYSQLVATPFVPAMVKDELKAMRAYYQRKERCLLCDLLKQEVLAEKRIVLTNEDYVILSPFAASYGYEMQVLPKRHRHEFENEEESKMESLAAILKQALTALEKVFLTVPAYTLIIITSPNEKADEASMHADQWKTLGEDFHWHINLLPSPLPLSGFEVGTGIHTNPIEPEEATERLRKFLPAAAKPH